LWSESTSYEIPVPVAKVTTGFLKIRRQEFGWKGEEEGLLDLQDPPFFVMTINHSRPEVRRRFTEAHEIGHFSLHDGKVLHRETKATVFGARDDAVGPQLGDELEASTFASCFLMPRSRILADARDLGTLGADFLAVLAHRYKVSESAARHRLFHLIPSCCFHGLAFADTGKIQLAVPTLQLEEQFEKLADFVWRMNLRTLDGFESYLPRHAIQELNDDRHGRFRGSGVSVPHLSSWDCAGLFADFPRSVPGELVLRPYGSDTLYYCFTPQASSLARAS